MVTRGAQALVGAVAVGAEVEPATVITSSKTPGMCYAICRVTDSMVR